jgi:hypothetical protein
MIRFSDLVGKTVKVVEVKGSEYDEDPSSSSQGITIEVEGVRYTLEAIIYGYGDDAEIWFCEKY